MNYDPYMIPATTTEGDLRNYRDTVEALQRMIAMVEIGADRLAQGATPAVMADFFRVAANEGRRATVAG